MYSIDQTKADCFVFTFKEGLLSAVAHDLKIRVTRFAIEVDEAARRVEGRFDAGSLRVACAMQDGVESKGTLSADQKRDIETNIVNDVLEAKKHPEAHFVSSAVEEDDGGFRVQGQLSLHGKRKSVTVVVRKDRNRYVASARVHQPDFGIRPYTAFLGTLKVKPDVEIQILVPWPIAA
jgi:polyisoprenoid-binding protein YceI